MYAIIATGGKQYKVSEGDVIRVEKLDVEAGNTVHSDSIRGFSNRFKSMVVMVRPEYYSSEKLSFRFLSGYRYIRYYSGS